MAPAAVFMGTQSKPLHIIILAAGEGTRMYSDQPKVLADLGGKPMLQHVLETVDCLQPEVGHLVYGFGGERLKAAFAECRLNWVEQKQRRGTGHAVALALQHIPDPAQVLVVYGDVPLATGEDLRALLAAAETGLGLLTMKLKQPQRYGRIVRDAHGSIEAIVEASDADEETLRIKEVNSGFMAAQAGTLKLLLSRVKPANAQKEIYLTDVVAHARAQQVPVNGVHSRHPERLKGANDRLQLAHLERHYQRIRGNQLMLAGVAMRDPKRVDIRGEIEAGRDVTLDIGVVLEGAVQLGDGAYVGPYCHLKNTSVGKGCRIESHSVVDGASLGENCTVGPFAHLRPGTVLESGAKIGNFVETKEVHLGANSKANHLSYLGDAEVGAAVNVGAGTITCNYDGINKHRTIIGDGAFIGSGTQLVAPVKIGKGATIGAGSTITSDTADDKLTLSRTRQTTIDKWQRPTDKPAKQGD